MKKTLIELSIVLVGAGILLGLIFYKNKKENVILVQMCPTDVMMCPDGSSVARSGTSCEFGVCKQELPSYLVEKSQEIKKNEISSTSPLSLSPQIAVKNKPLQTSPVTSNLFEKIRTQASSFFSSAAKSVSTSVVSGIETTSIITQNKEVVSATQASSLTQATSVSKQQTLNETRYKVEDGKIITSDNGIVYTIPKITSSSSASNGSWTTTIVDVVPVNAVTPIIGAVPVDGLPGKYYLSENSFGSLENCEFSNKIYILDTVTGSRTLMFEENSSTLAKDDERSCNSEIYLLATEAEKLIMKYHTVGTNTVCDSTWSEPGKTWYLDVTKLSYGSKRYAIPAALYAQAEQEENVCRTQFEQQNILLQRKNNSFELKHKIFFTPVRQDARFH
jgi:hypothetical protein